jgi:CRISPR-associated protein Cas5t
MSSKTLFIELFQPFAQFRNPFTFYYAQTFPLPPKSTIIGMLQNACDDWYGSKCDVEKWWGLKVSVHGGFESTFWNYQSLIKGDVGISKEGKLINQGLPLYGEGITSQRTPVFQQELFNGHLYIFIKGEENLIAKIKEALEKPSKVLTLGRSEDVVFIKKLMLGEEMNTEKKNVKGNILLAFPTYLINKGLPIRATRYPVYSIPVKVCFKNGNQPVKHKAEINKQTEREVEFETVVYTGYDYNLLLNLEREEVSYEVFLIEDKKFKILDEYGWL